MSRPPILGTPGQWIDAAAIQKNKREVSVWLTKYQRHQARRRAELRLAEKVMQSLPLAVQEKLAELTVNTLRNGRHQAVFRTWNHRIECMLGKDDTIPSVVLAELCLLA